MFWKTITYVGLLLILAVGTATGQTITVDTFDDVTDFGGAQQVEDLPGLDGVVSFRESCIATNNTPGPQTIEFAIPADDPGWQNGVVMLYMDFYVFVLTDDETTVDFTTQTAYTGDTNPNGNEVGIQCSITAAGVPAIIVAGDRCVIKGLDHVTWAGYAVELTGNDNRVIGCTISGPLYAAVNVEGIFGGPTAAGNVIGGTDPGDGNLLSGVSVLGNTDSTVVIGNTVRPQYVQGELDAISFCDSQNGWAVGYSGVVLHTIDGGDHWLQQNAGASQQTAVTGVTAVSPTTAWIAGWYGFVAHTTDGGLTWQTENVPGATGVDFEDLLFTGAHNGWVGGNIGIWHRSCLPAKRR